MKSEKLDIEEACDSLIQYQKYINKEIFIFIPGIEPDPFWGTIDCQPPHIRKAIIQNIKIASSGIVIRASGCDYEIKSNFKFFLDKVQAENYLAEKV